ncbi:MAG: hypothetical protein Q8R36_05015, partial [bacterium]|nr:hypothetical protein [bacterium]
MSYDKTALGISVVLLIIIGGLFFLNSPKNNNGAEVNSGIVSLPDAPLTILPENNTTEKGAEVINGASINDQKQDVARIIYTRDGFFPKTIDVRTGDVVEFFNKSG